MYKDKTVSLVLPCYNEEEGLKYILTHRPSFFDEVIVVDNNSNDCSRAIASSHNALIHFLFKRGYGRACQKGLKEATGEIILFMDSDATYPIDQAEDLIREIADNKCDFISGCRFPLVERAVMPLIKRASNRFISFLIRYLFSISLQDSQSGMIAFRKDLLKKILPKNIDMEFGMRLKLQAWTFPDIRCDETHINYRVRKGKVKYRALIDGLKTLCDMLFFYCVSRRSALKT